MTGFASTLPVRFNYRNTIDDIWNRVLRQPEGCWPWMGATRGRGYGHLRVGGALIAAHRAAYKSAVGDPGELHVLHTCDNAVCCRPSHLFLGTNQDNVDDKMRKNRRRGKRKLTDEQVRSIRASNETTADIARAFGISWHCADNVRAGRSWSNV